jgi:ISXO2-like transposase domain
MKDEFAAHSEITHKTKKYVRRDGNFKVTTNTVESFFALLKRSNYGIHHHMSRKYLGLYCAERDFVYNGRKLNDDERTTVFLKEDQRFIFRDEARDSAVILIQTSDLQLPKMPIQLLPIDNRLPIGAEVGWLGYPAIGAPNTLCFFSGNVSAWQEFRHAYLIDGVAINGVSGGPVIYSTAIDGVQIIGTISAYMANRATGEALPGLSVAQDVSHFHDTASQIRSFDEAKKKVGEQPAFTEQAGGASA